MISHFLYLCIIVLPTIFSKIGWWRWKHEGLENLPPRTIGGMVLAMNHAHWIDILAVGTLVPLSHRPTWLGKSELFASRFGNWFFTTMKVIPVRRGKSDVSAMGETEHVLQQGAVMLVFPEGHRSKDGALQKAFSGAIRLATRTNSPIVPVAVVGTHGGLKHSFRRAPVTFYFGKPYQLVLPENTKKIPPRVMNQLITDMMVRVGELMPEELWGYYAPQIREHIATQQKRV